MHVFQGSPKVWLIVPPSDRDKVIMLMGSIHETKAKEKCIAPYRHKTLFLLPELLEKHEVNTLFLILLNEAKKKSMFSSSSKIQRG